MKIIRTNIQGVTYTTTLVPLEEYDFQCIRQLQGVTFLPGSFDKRFCHGMNIYLGVYPAGTAPLTMSDKQQRLLRYMVHRYRRQIPEHVCNEWCKSFKR